MMPSQTHIISITILANHFPTCNIHCTNITTSAKSVSQGELSKGTGYSLPGHYRFLSQPHPYFVW